MAKKVEVKSVGRSREKAEDMKMVEVQKNLNWCVPKLGQVSYKFHFKLRPYAVKYFSIAHPLNKAEFQKALENSIWTCPTWSFTLLPFSPDYRFFDVSKNNLQVLYRQVGKYSIIIPGTLDNFSPNMPHLLSRFCLKVFFCFFFYRP